jgi:selenide, water dikinase
MPGSTIRLTDLAHGGGCGCKLAPSVLQSLLADQPLAGSFSQLLVGAETADDAAVWQVDENLAVIATTDFFMPMVDDPYDFGRIAATNAISDIYAMGGSPIMALAILGIPVAGGHSIDSPEPIYGLAVIGLGRPAQIRRNTGARPGDALLLTKGIGIGIYSAAIKRGALPGGAYEEMIRSTTLLNRVGAELASDPAVHGVTDVTGFGLLGHALEMARGSGLALTIRLGEVPLLTQAASLAGQGFVTGASQRNWASYGDEVELPADCPEWQRMLLTDPQTSGGLLIACAAEAADGLVARIRDAGFPLTRRIGSAAQGTPGIQVI